MAADALENALIAALPLGPQSPAGGVSLPDSFHGELQARRRAADPTSYPRASRPLPANHPAWAGPSSPGGRSCLQGLRGWCMACARSRWRRLRCPAPRRGAPRLRHGPPEKALLPRQMGAAAPAHRGRARGPGCGLQTRARARAGDAAGGAQPAGLGFPLAEQPVRARGAGRAVRAQPPRRRHQPRRAPPRARLEPGIPVPGGEPGLAGAPSAPGPVAALRARPPPRCPHGRCLQARRSARVTLLERCGCAAERRRAHGARGAAWRRRARGARCRQGAAGAASGSGTGGRAAQVLTISVHDSRITGRTDLGAVRFPLSRMPSDGRMSAWLPVQARARWPLRPGSMPARARTGRARRAGCVAAAARVVAPRCAPVPAQSPSAC